MNYCYLFFMKYFINIINVIKQLLYFGIYPKIKKTCIGNAFKQSLRRLRENIQGGKLYLVLLSYRAKNRVRIESSKKCQSKKYAMVVHFPSRKT